MTVTTDALRELVDSYDAAALPPLSSVLVRCPELPAELPADLAIGEVAEITGVSAHSLRYGLTADDFRRTQPQGRARNLAANLKLVEEIRARDGRYAPTPSQVALAWVRSRGDDVVLSTAGYGTVHRIVGRGR